MAITGLASSPRDVFWIILKYLEPIDIIRCRRVSRQWREAFSDPANLAPLMRIFFPCAKESRELFSRRLISDDGVGRLWRSVFDQLSCRYHHLALGKPRSVKKYILCDDFGITGEREWFPVQPWENHASHLIQRVDFPLAETFWTYEDGLIVYPSADHHCLVLMDLETDQKVMVPFLVTGKVVRRVRLQHGVLVVEWAEPKAFHWLNDSDGVHRHFATSFDITRRADEPQSLSVVFRNEWKIMFLGHPLSERDRFLSSHTKTHYTIYIWQPNRSLYTADEDAPIESLFVWDISKPSSYRPSLDPTGRLKGDEQDNGPCIVARFGFRELGFYSVRQRGLPSVQRLEVTPDGRSVEITENICTGPMDRLVGPAEWTSQVHTTSIPLLGDGPCWRREVPARFPPYRGNGSLQASPLASTMPTLPWYTVISEAVDAQAQVRFCIHTSPGTWPFNLKMFLSIYTPVSQVTLEPEEISELAGKGKICGTERFLVGEGRNRELVVYRFDR